MASKGPVVYIVIYSLFHHVYEVSLAVRKGKHPRIINKKK
jgi:hypothetical protein